MSVTESRSPVAPPAPSSPLAVDPVELAERSAAFERQPASAVVRWAVETFGEGLVLAASFQDCVLVDLAVRVAPEIEVVFLDTHFHFADTLDYVEAVRARYDLNLRVMEPLVAVEDDPRPVDGSSEVLEECCAMRKVEPLARALEGRTAWMTGLRRSDAPTRAGAPIVGIDVARGIVKVNPLANWTTADVERYRRDHELPEHPLSARGYPSIGCWPCTRPVAAGADPRSGRWAATGKTECGLHGWG